MDAKQELFSRLEYLDAAVGLPQVIDEGIVPTTHNGVANLLRKGLGIVAFNILEDYIKNRSREALKFLSDSGILFEKLTESLQRAAITGVLSALSTRATLLQRGGEDWKTLVQDESLKIHSTKSSPFEISPYSFFSINSNINASEIPDLLAAFGVGGVWNILKNISDQIGGGLPDLAQAYKNAADRRNRAAHTASFRYDYQWLQGIKNEILAIAASLDIVLTARCRQISDNLGTPIADHDIREALNFRFLERSGMTFKEKIQINGPARKNWLSLDDAVIALMPRLRQNNSFLIVLDQTRRINDWRT